MAREIKWRAFYKGKMRYWPEVRFKWQGKGMTTHYIPERKSVKAEVMQYTGLKDKNGVEIYEGDIVRKPRDLHIGDVVVAHQGEFQDDAFIEWVDGSFRLNKIGSDSRNYYGVLNYSENTQPELLEVIGNIYENPDLLKGEPNE